MFKVGDIIKGTESCNSIYTITTNRATLKILGFEPTHDLWGKYAIRAKLIDHKDNSYKRYIGEVYLVDSRLFIPEVLDNRKIKLG